MVRFWGRVYELTGWEWVWRRMLAAAWLKPAPRVEPRYRPDDETGVDDPRLLGGHH